MAQQNLENLSTSPLGFKLFMNASNGTDKMCIRDSSTVGFHALKALLRIMKHQRGRVQLLSLIHI